MHVCFYSSFSCFHSFIVVLVVVVVGAAAVVVVVAASAAPAVAAAAFLLLQCSHVLDSSGTLLHAHIYMCKCTYE